MDELGYGPRGEHTRREWREECLGNLRAGNSQFEAWQESWKVKDESHQHIASFAVRLDFSDGSKSVIFASNSDRMSSCSLDFAGCTFTDELDFCYKKFQQAALFFGATFREIARFDSAKFNWHAYFNFSSFKKAAHFNVTKYGGSAEFSDAYFNWSSYFERITFSYVSFSRAIFNGGVAYSHTDFEGKSEFNNATFKSRVDFQNSEIKRDANFNKTCFCDDVDFRNIIFNSNIDFKNSVFHKRINFEKAVFKNVGHFEQAKFVTHTPAFRGCQTDTTRLEFSDDSYFPTYESTDDAIKNISFLKRLADEHGQTDQALNFNAMELRAKRFQTEPITADWSFKVVTWLYEKLSDYGRSFAKPIFWYGVLICLSAIFAMLYSTYSDSPTNERQELCKQIKDQPSLLKLSYGRAVVEYAMFRAGGLMDFTDTGKQNNAVNCRLFEEPIEPPLMRAWGILKGIASIALLFLAALGLRNKYRIK